MSIEQTAQLIQLVLNSMLMLVGCALVSNRLGMRHSILVDRLQSLMAQYTDLLEAEAALPPGLPFTSDPHLILAKKQLRQLQSRYTLTYSSLLAVHAALLLAIGNVFLLSLRSLLDLDWLIPLAFCSLHCWSRFAAAGSRADVGGSANGRSGPLGRGAGTSEFGPGQRTAQVES